MVNTLRVMLWDEEIGRLAWDDRRRLSYFTYNPEFLKKGIDVSPLQAPVRVSGSAFIPCIIQKKQ